MEYGLLLVHHLTIPSTISPRRLGSNSPTSIVCAILLGNPENRAEHDGVVTMEWGDHGALSLLERPEERDRWNTWNLFGSLN